MRILAIGSLYPPYHLGGYELVWQAGVRALRSAGHEVRVLTTGEHLGKAPGEPEDPDVHRELRWYWHDHEFPRLSVRARLELERHNSLTLRRHIQELRPELVSWWAMGGMSLSLIEQARRAGLPAVGWVNDEWLGYGPRVDQWMHLWRVAGPMASSPRRLAQAAWKASGSPPIDVDFERAATWVFCSEITRRSALRSRPDLTRTQVLYQGVDPVFRAIDPPERWRGRLLYAGRLDERKGLGTLIEAVAHQPELSLRIVGDGDQRTARELRDQAHAEGARVSFDPGVDRAALARVYGEADAVVFPVEWSEPWGLVPLEAMAVGRPVVATGRGGSGEYLEHEGNALLFQAGDALALRAAVGRLAADRGLREQLRLGGFETAARFSETAWLDAVVRVHEEAAAH